MLLLHGYLSSKEAFAAQIEYFSRFFTVTAIDFLGFGHTRDLTKAFSVGDYAQWLQGVMTLLNVEKPHVIAHSFGCRVAVKAASENEQLFDKIILTGPAGVILRRNWKYHAKVRLYRFVRRFAPSWAEKHFGSAEYRTLSPMMKESYKKIVNEDLLPCAAKIKNKVCIIEGTEDVVTTMAEACLYQQTIVGSVLKKIDGGHFAFAEHAAAFNLAVEEFLYG